MVCKQQGGCLTSGLLNGGGHTALKLVVIIRVQEVVFAVVLVMKHHLHGAEGLFQTLSVRVGDGFSVITPSAPGKIGLAQVRSLLPLT